MVVAGGRIKDLSNATSIHVSTFELKTLAETIAGAVPAIGVPATVLELLLDVITGHRVCAAWYSAHGSLA